MISIRKGVLYVNLSRERVKKLKRLELETPIWEKKLKA